MSRNNPWSARAIIERIEREKQQAAAATRPTDETPAVGYSVRGLWSCFADPGELTTAQAHTAMQLHLGCGVSTCCVRRRARIALVAAGHMVLDPRATQTREVAPQSLFTLLRLAILSCAAQLFGGRHALR